MNVAMSVGLAFAAIIGVCLFVLWYGSATVIDKHEDRITVMERRWAEQFGGPKPAAELEPDTDEIPVAPPTVPDGMPLAVQSALLRPSPVPHYDSDEAKARKAAWVEAELNKIRARIDAAGVLP